MSEISCQEVLHELEHYVDGELDPVRSAHLAEHLDMCAPCLQRADFRVKLKEIVRTRCGPVQAPERLLSRVREAIREEENRA